MDKKLAGLFPEGELRKFLVPNRWWLCSVLKHLLRLFTWYLREIVLMSICSVGSATWPRSAITEPVLVGHMIVVDDKAAPARSAETWAGATVRTAALLPDSKYRFYVNSPLLPTTRRRRRSEVLMKAKAPAERGGGWQMGTGGERNSQGHKVREGRGGTEEAGSWKVRGEQRWGGERFVFISESIWRTDMARDRINIQELLQEQNKGILIPNIGKKQLSFQSIWTV